MNIQGILKENRANDEAIMEENDSLPVCPSCGDRSCYQYGTFCNGNDYGYDDIAQDPI